MSYDGKCWDLAYHFLLDEPATKDGICQHAGKLAQIIQDAIEDYLRFQVNKEEQ